MSKIKIFLFSILLIFGSQILVGENVFRRSQSRVGSLDPIMAGSVPAAEACALIYDVLLEYDYEARPYRLRPAIAKTLPERSSDDLTYIFKLRDDCFFADDACFENGIGRAITADDFVFAWKRLVDRKLTSAGAWLVEDVIAGMKDFAEASGGQGSTDYSMPVAGLQALDSHTLKVTLVRPFNQFLWFVAMPFMTPVPHEAVKFYGSKLGENPICTGPYKLDFWWRNYKMDFKLNKKWRGWQGVDFNAEVVPFDRVQYLIIEDASTQWLAFLSGQLDWLAQISRDNWDVAIDKDGNLVGELGNRGIKLHSAPTLKTYYLGFNMDDPIIGKNKKLRQALNAAFDAERWVKYNKNKVLPLTTPSPPQLEGALQKPFPYKFNLSLAKKLLEEAGYKDGRDPATGRRLVLNLDIGNTAQDSKESMELLASFLGKIGIDLRVNTNAWPEFLKKVANRKAQIFLIGWVGDYPDIENFMQVFLSRNQSPGPNRSNYENPEFDDLYEKAITEPDATKKNQYWASAQEFVREDCPWLFLHYAVDYILIHERILNYKTHDFPYGNERYYRVKRKQ